MSGIGGDNTSTYYLDKNNIILFCSNRDLLSSQTVDKRVGSRTDRRRQRQYPSARKFNE